MSNLNRDILYLIFKQFKDDKVILHSCLLVNKTWCEILFQFYGKILENLKSGNLLLLKAIISHLSDILRNNTGEHNLLTNS
jgi:hypothetical protein